MTVPKGTVIGTDPPVNQMSAITNEITIAVSSGPGTASVPDVRGQTVDVANQNLTAFGFPPGAPFEVDSTKPKGQVVGTNPPVGQVVPTDTPIQVQISLGNQFRMPDVTGKFWDDLLPLLRGMGWTGVLDNEEVAAGDGNRAKVIDQDPPAGQPVDKTATIKLIFGS